MNSFFENTISECRSFLIGIANGSIKYSSNPSILEQYQRYRRILAHSQLLIGKPPDWLLEHENVENFWSFISNSFSTYQERKNFINEQFESFYKDALEGIFALDFKEYVALRGLDITEELGRGGFGIVYLAENKITNTQKAIKLFDPMFYNGEAPALRRFPREARLMSRLNHQNIVKFSDAGIYNKQPFIVMNYIEGKDLERILKDTGILPYQSVIKIGIQISDALAYLHKENAVHRDVKPSNVIWDGINATLLDLGIGIETNTETTRLTGSSAVGSSQYIAPELLENSSLIDIRSDIYSLGMLLHKTATNRFPSLGAPYHILDAANIPKKFSDIILKCLNPLESRYNNALAVKHKLAELLGEEATPFVGRSDFENSTVQWWFVSERQTDGQQILERNGLNESPDLLYIIHQTREQIIGLPSILDGQNYYPLVHNKDKVWYLDKMRGGKAYITFDKLNLWEIVEFRNVVLRDNTVISFVCNRV